MSDFITRYILFFRRITDAPTSFQEAAALFLISTATKRNFIFRSIPETSIFSSNERKALGKPLNLWIILLGKSRVTRKSTGVIRHAEDLIKDTLGERLLLSKAFTPEYMLKEMSEKTFGGETHCVWINDETAAFFQQLRKRDSYLAGVDAVLSTIYDGTTYSRGTIKREKEIALNPYLTCLLSSTNYLPTLFDELHMRLGYLNRFLFVLSERKERKSLRTTPLTADEKKEVDYIKEYLRALAHRKSTTTMTMSKDAKEVYDSFERKIETRIEKEELDEKEGFFANCPNFAIRLSCIFRLSRMKPQEIERYSNPILEIDEQDIQRAIDYIWKAWTWFEKVIEIMQTKQAKRMRPRDRVKLAVVRLLNDGKEKHFDEIKSHIDQRGICCSQATLYNSLRDLVGEKKIMRSKFGFYKIRNEGDENKD